MAEDYEFVTNFTEMPNSNISTESQNINWFIVYVCIIALSVLASLKAIYVVMVQLKKSKRQNTVTLLIAHMSAVSICTLVSHMFNTSNLDQFLNPPDFLCGFTNFLKNVFYCAYALNTVAILHNRIQSSEPGYDNKKLVIRVVSIIWLFSLIFSIPTAMMSESVTIPENSTRTCKPVNLMDSPAATIAYEVLRLILFSLITTPLIYNGLLTMSANLTFLGQATGTQSERRQNDVRSIRFVCFQLAAMIFLWIPGGLFILAHRVLGRLDPANNIDSWPVPLKFLCFFIIAFMCLYALVNPFISLLLLESSVTKTKFGICCPTFERKPCTSRKIVAEDIPLANLNETGRVCDRQDVESSESASRFATVVGLTSEVAEV